VIEASDVRPAVKEQIESLGAKFIDVPFETDEEREIAKGVGGYARPMPPAWLQRQKAEVAKRIAQADIVITTALIPGRPAPRLVTEDMVRAMKPGSVIVDMAAEQGGNCELTEPGSTVARHNVQIIGLTNLPALAAADSSALYARNILDFLKLLFDKEGGFVLNRDDDIVAACLMCHNGEIVRSPDQPDPEPEPAMELVNHLIIFVLAIYVGYHVVWNVTPALHTPLMSVTNAISAIIIVGAMLAAALTETRARPDDGRAGGGAGGGQRVRRLPGHAADAGDVQEKKSPRRATAAPGSSGPDQGSNR